MTQQNKSDWGLADEVYEEFRIAHPELFMGGGKWGFHNFLRYARDQLVAGDAIRKVKGKHWIANRKTFNQVAFEVVTLGYEKAVTDGVDE
jgi:hypothetical protein